MNTATRKNSIRPDTSRLAAYVSAGTLAALLCLAGCGSVAPKVESNAAPGSNFISVIAVVPVQDQPAAVEWYRKWLGRNADVTPTAGVAEWQLADNAWLQVAADPEHAGKTTVIVGVRDIEAHLATCASAGVALGELVDMGFIKMVEALDPEGNKVVFVQEVQQVQEE